MRTVILSLKDAVETGLRDIDLLDKQDKVIFVYLKGKDSISIQVHTALAQLKCKIEFYEIPDENATKQDMPMYFAFLAGSNPNPCVVDTGAEMAKLTYLNIPRHPDFKSILSKKASTGPTKGNIPRSRKPRTKDTADKKPSMEKYEEKEYAPTVKEESQKIETPKPQNSSAKPIGKHKSSSTGTASMDDLKAYLKEQATDSFNPATLTMGIYEAVSKTVLKGTLISEELENIIIIDSKITALNNALQGKWGKVTDIVTGILKEKGKI